MDKLGKVMTINLRHRAGHPPGEFAEGFPPELVRLPPAETPRGGRSWRGKLGWGVVFLLLLMLVRWMFGQTVAAASPALSQPPRVFAVPEVPLAQTTRVSVAADGTEGNGGSFTPAISADGNWVAFVSGATNLTGTPTDGTWQVHLKDLASGAVTLVSVATTGEVGDDNSLNPALDASGRYVAFDSLATNLGAGANVWANVFVHDTETLTTTLVSVAADGTPGNGESEKSALSADGRYVVFESSANNLVADDFSYFVDIFVHDRDADADGVFDEPGAILTRRMSQAANGTPANAVSTAPDISASGRWIVFTSAADNLVANDTNAADDVFLYDRDTDEDNVFDESGAVSVTLLSVGVGGAPANGFSANPVISADGRQVAFESFATNLVAGGTAVFQQHIFVRDWQAGVTTLVSQSSAGVEGDDWAQAPALSEDGRWVVFESQAENLVAGDTNFGRDVFVRDRDVDDDGVLDEAGQVATVRVSVDSLGGQMDGGQAYNGTLSWDGQQIVFEADANDLVVGDNNFRSDVFLHVPQGATAGADLSLAYEALAIGQTLRLDVALHNQGPDPASDVRVQAEVWGDPLYGIIWLDPCLATGCLLSEMGVGTTATYILLASVYENPYQVYQGWISVAIDVTSPTNDPVPTNQALDYTTHFYACAATDGCALDNIVCFLLGLLPLSGPESTDGFIPHLALYYQVRDEILTSPTGRAYTDLYYAHSDEVSELVFADDDLWDLTLDGLFLWEPNFTALVAGQGEMAVITAAQIQAVEDFLNALAEAGSPALQQAIAEERANLPPFDTFIGMTMDEARGAVVGYGVYLPMVVEENK